MLLTGCVFLSSSFLDHASQIQVSLLVAEGMMMFNLTHPNIQSVWAVCLEAKKQPMLLYQYLSHGNLKCFLQKCKFSPEGHAYVSAGEKITIIGGGRTGFKSEFLSMIGDSYARISVHGCADPSRTTVPTRTENCSSRFSHSKLCVSIQDSVFLHQWSLSHTLTLCEEKKTTVFLIWALLFSPLIFCFFFWIRVDDNFTVRITDNALARDLFPNDYHCLGDNENRPIKWLALESLIGKQFSTSSDVVSPLVNVERQPLRRRRGWWDGRDFSFYSSVSFKWAFGVTLWELMTLGQQPYMEIDPFEMAAYLKDGYRLSQPINCPDEL